MLAYSCFIVRWLFSSILVPRQFISKVCANRKFCLKPQIPLRFPVKTENHWLYSSSSAHVAVELDSIFASGKHRESGFEKVDLIVHGKMTFLFTTEYVKIRLQLQILC